MSELRVSIDRDNCIGCGACWVSCPDVFEQNQADGHSQVVGQYRAGDSLSEGKIPETLEGCAKSAEEACPVQVIRLTRA
ncbi:ferredoxin [Candidatus Hadarchaeum sp.]|uniref:ferredoxin n=1 Tax=Candidatus Hadarchaeum sp. TaxID=2883567 RepID=UPI00319D98EF